MRMPSTESCTHPGEERETKETPPCPAPGTLTTALAKNAIKELIRGRTADELLCLRICDPFTASGEYLREAADLLAQAYLALKQEETGLSIPHGEYADEKAKAVSWIGHNNLFGVAPDPASVALIEASLSTENATGPDRESAPGTGPTNPHLVCGNALIGAGRRVFDARLLRRADKAAPLWLDQVPLRIMPGKKRPDHTVFHFLLPDKGMADYRDKFIKEIAEQEIGKIRAWRKAFFKPLTVLEIRQLESLSQEVDKLWERHCNNAFRRLKLVMNYWCALWFWPVEKADLLPTRHAYLKDLALVLTGNTLDILPSEQLSLFPERDSQEQRPDLAGPDGYVDVDRLCANSQRLELVASLGRKYRFFHWELEFAELFEERGGFDLVLGNPPWSRSQWEESRVPGGNKPLCEKGDSSAKGLKELRKELPENHDLVPDYLEAFERDAGTRNFLSAGQNYPHAKGSRPEICKCFLFLSWMLTNESGISGLLLPEDIYEASGEERSREILYFRLRSHIRFNNKNMLLAGLPRHTRFGITISGKIQSDIDFSYIAGTGDPRAIGTLPGQTGLKEVTHTPSDKNTGNMEMHHGKIMEEQHGRVVEEQHGGIVEERHGRIVEERHGRVIRVGIKELELFAELFEKEGTPATSARLPELYADESIHVLKKLLDSPRKLGDLKDRCFSTRHWKERESLNDGTLKRETCFPKDADRLILSPGHFSVGNPFFGSPGSTETRGSRFPAPDLWELPDDYLPRALYVPGCDPVEYRERTPRVPWYDLRPVTDHYRFTVRETIGASAERALIPIILPRGAGHIHTCASLVFKNIYNMVDFFCLCLSIPMDFLVRASGAGHVSFRLMNRLPLLTDNRLRPLLHARALMLCCLTRHYSELWSDCFDPEFNDDKWAGSDPRLSDELFEELTPQWNRNCALRTDYQRRQALVEIDVLSAMALGITLEELKILYRAQFRKMRFHESDTWYDRKGRIVFTPNSELRGTGLGSKEWKRIREMKTGTVEHTLVDDTLPQGPVERTFSYHAPFDRCDREKDYEAVWAKFHNRLG